MFETPAIMCGVKGRRFRVLFKRNWISWFQKISIWSYWLTNKAYLSTITVTNISRSFTHKMAAKTSWHRYGTKLRHRRPMHILKLNKTCTFAKAKRELEVVCGMSAAARTSGNIVYRRCWRGTVCRNSNANKINLYRSMFLDVQLVMFTQRSNAFAMHSLHACMHEQRVHFSELFSISAYLSVYMQWPKLFRPRHVTHVYI